MAYQLDARRDIRGQTLFGETVVLSDGECLGLVESTFSSGTLKLAQSSGAAAIVRSTVKDSQVIAVKRQRNFNFFSARFVNCSFRGVYSGISFGRTGDGDALDDYGGVESCDFVEATLDGCQLINTDVTSSRLPRWPHVVVTDPAQRAAEVARMEWPGQLGKYMQICTSTPAFVKAIVLYIPTLSQLVGCTEEQARKAFERLGGVLL